VLSYLGGVTLEELLCSDAQTQQEAFLAAQAIKCDLKIMLAESMRAALEDKKIYRSWVQDQQMFLPRVAPPSEKAMRYNEETFLGNLTKLGAKK